MSSRYGGLFQIEDFGGTGPTRLLERVALSGSKASSGYDEAWLQRMLASHPQALPINEIEPFLTGAVPVCLEFGTNAGPVDLVLVSPRGDIVLVECKLWRNPQARREVVGQIIDYAKELPRLTYEAFEAAICKAEPASGALRSDPLYKRAGAEADGVEEAKFIDALSRNLRRGRFLLLIVGDGIQEGVENIAEFLQQHAGMHFTLALVEMAIFKVNPAGFLVQPRVLAKTQMVQRGVVSIDDDRIHISPDPTAAPTWAGSPKFGTPSTRPTVSPTISEARLYEELEARLPGVASELRHFIAALENQGAPPRFTPTAVILQGNASSRTLTLARIDSASATVWLEDVVNQAGALGRTDAALTYYRALVDLLTDETMRVKKLNPKTKTGTASLPLADMLLNHDKWFQAVVEYLASMDISVSA